MGFYSGENIMSLPIALYSAEQVAQLDQCAISNHGLPGIVLMKRAGKVAFDILLKQWPGVGVMHVVCGSGNNGGDGYIVAALAAQRKIPATVWQLGEPKTESAKMACQYALQEGVIAQAFDESVLQEALNDNASSGVIVDALLGVGVIAHLREPYSSAIDVINSSTWPVLSVDLPAGINADNGAVRSGAVKADVTVSFIGQKLGNLVGQGRVNSGQRYFNDLSVPTSVYEKTPSLARRLELSSLLAELSERSLDTHKGDYGHVLVVGGDLGYGGAPLMAAEMAVRTGAGLVGVATQPSHTSAMIARRPELMAVGVASGQEFLPFLEKPSVLVVGPGLGQSAWSEQLLYHSISLDKPMVLDADALNLLASNRFNLAVDAEKISTPHPGEAARLLGVSIAEVQADRVAAIKALQEKLGGVVVLKGAGTLVITTDKSLYVCDAGNPGMASGGMGDVLSGLLGSLLAQGLSIDTAACLGTLLHSEAADLAVSKGQIKGLLATDLIDYVRLLLNPEYTNTNMNSNAL